MIHPLPSKKRSVILSGAIAAAALLLSPDAAQAGTAERNALLATLQAQGKDLNTASAQELAEAVSSVIANNTKFKPGIVAGEALKSIAAISQDAGDEIANAILERFTTGGIVNRPELIRAVGDAAKTAGTSKGANVNEVPLFSATLLEGNDEARQAASLAIASKTGAGAILGGAASEAASDDIRVNLVNGALVDPKLKAAVLEISRFVAIEAEDSDNFALRVAQANTKLAAKIAVGAAAGVPENAGEIVRQMASADSTDLQTVILKGALGLAKQVAAVADIEQITLIGKAIADEINTLGTNGKPLFKPQQAPALVKTLAKAILAKPITGTAGLTADNKADEIAEVAAFVVNGVLANGQVTAKTAPKLVLAIIKAAVSGGKASAKQTALAADASYVADIAGSVALTVQNSSLSAEIKTAIRQFLLDPAGKYAKQIGGTNAPAVTAALNLGFGTPDATTGKNTDPEANTRLEDGNIPELALADPETDKRNF